MSASGLTVRPRAIRRLAGWLTLALIAAPALAEVAVVDDGESKPRTRLMAITDHPDPIGQVAWAPVTEIDPTRLLNPEGYARGDGGPAIAHFQADGRPVVVWAYQTGTDFDVALSEWTGQAWSPPVFISETSANDLDPRVAVDDADGSVHVVWWVDGAIETVYLASRDPGGTWSLAEPVTGPDGGRRPSVIIHQGLIHVAYERASGDGDGVQEVVVARKEPPLGLFTHEVVASTSRTGRIDPVLHRNDVWLWVDWKHDFDQFGSSLNDGAGWAPWSTISWEDPTWIGVEQLRQTIAGEILP